MSLRVAVAAPFQGAGTRTMEESRFVVSLSLDRDWFSPDQAKRLIDVAVSEGLLERTDAGLEAAFPVESVAIPEEFSPGEDLLVERSPFERVLEAIVDSGVEKQAAVARINELQRELGITVEVAAVVVARRQGADVSEDLPAIRGTLNREG